MKIRIFILGADASEQDALLDSVLKKTFAEQLGENGIIETYKTVKEATASIQTAFADAQTVIFAAPQSCYGNIKNVITRAFGIRLEKDSIVFDRAHMYAPEQLSKSEDFEFTHGMLPVNGKIFMSSDGLFSGFASVRGEQSVIFMPYSADRTCSMLSAQIIPFINSQYSQSIPVCYSEHIYAEPLNDLLKEENVNIALALTKTADLFVDYISSCDELKMSINKTPRSEARGNIRPSEYVVNLSIAAAELQGVPYGIVISNAYYMDENSKDRLTVFMAVTNAEQTTVREVKSFAWETSSEFMRRCCGELCKLLTDIIKADRLGGTDDKAPENPKKIQKFRVAIAITGAAIIFLCIAGWYLFTSNSYSLSDWAQNHLPAIFGQQTISDDAGELEADEADIVENEGSDEESQSVTETLTESETHTVTEESEASSQEGTSNEDNVPLG